MSVGGEYKLILLLLGKGLQEREGGREGQSKRERQLL